MSKLSPLGQSMASLFTPESERNRTSQGKAATARAPKGSFPVAGAKGIKSDKPGDSLGNPNSPGYEHFGKKQNPPPADAHPDAPGPGGTVIETTTQGPELVRLSVGWELLIVAQKKLCAKAKGLFTLLEGPGRYASQKKNNYIRSKSCGSILDLDLQETAEEIAARNKEEEAENKKKTA